MNKFNTLKIIFVLLALSWIISCSSGPEKELVDIDNVLTDKAKKEALAKEKLALQQAGANQPLNSQSDKTNANKPLYPIVTATPIMRPVTVSPNPALLAKEPSDSEEVPDKK